MMVPVANRVDNLLRMAPEVYYNWVIILNKLTRLLADPLNIDSWKDIAGYASLVVNYLEEKGKE